MQTFLPFADFAKSASVLDNKRLGKQRVECLQILQTLAKGEYVVDVTSHAVKAEIAVTGVWPRKTAWYNHPAVRMWRGYNDRLAEYSLIICDEWLKRGFKDTCRAKIGQLLLASPYTLGMIPNWLGNSDFHASHRSNLLRKDPIYYSKFGWTEPPTLSYVWSV
jgi:Pyrimidine dimer DNA glycosylase